MIDYLEKFSLRNKKAVVTGGAGLIGTQVVIALAQAGARVIIADINEEKARELETHLQQNSLLADYCPFDSTDIDNSKDLVAQLVKKLGGLDIWINCSYPRTKDFCTDVEDILPESWRKNVDMHLNSYAFLCKHAAEHMKTSGGSIINFGSTYGVVSNDLNLYIDTPMKTSMAYCAIKGGITNLSRYLSVYFGGYNIRVNTICPGGVFDNQNELFLKRYSQRAPLKRMANADEIASTVLFLASDAASYISGATIMVDGGWTAI